MKCHNLNQNLWKSMMTLQFVNCETCKICELSFVSWFMPIPNWNLPWLQIEKVDNKWNKSTNKNILLNSLTSTNASLSLANHLPLLLVHPSWPTAVSFHPKQSTFKKICCYKENKGDSARPWFCKSAFSSAVSIPPLVESPHLQLPSVEV